MKSRSQYLSSIKPLPEPTRLFDLLPRRKTLGLETSVFTYKVNGQWVQHGVDACMAYVNAVSYALLHLGVKRGENVALISAGRPEWNFIDYGVQEVGAVLVPIYPTISLDDYCYILNNAEVRFIFVETSSLLHKMLSIKDRLPLLQEIYVINDTDEAPTFAQLVDMGKRYPAATQVDAICQSISTDDVATIIYTSGTTGVPKGVMLTHRGILLNVLGIKDSPGWNWDRALSWMPLCHIYERMMNYLYQYLCMETFYAESIAHVADNAQEVNPYIMAAVPRFIEKIYDRVYRRGEKLTGLKRRIFFWALEVGAQYDLDPSQLSLSYKMKHFFADFLVYKEIRKVLGNNFSMLVSGGASIQPRLTRFFSSIGLDIYEGYGLTECSPLIAVTNTYAKLGRKVGSVGFVLDGIDVRVDADTHEILCRGGNVMKGYFKAPELTAEAVDADGWFHTGDTGFIDADGYMFITGRTKTMFKTSMGKFVNPEVIEEKFKESPFILDMMVIGEGQKFAAAIIAPDFELLRDWCKRHGVEATTRDEMVSHPTVLARYQRVMDKYNALLGNTEQVKRFHLTTDTWSTDNGFLTPTLKIRRKNLAQAYAADIEALFR